MKIVCESWNVLMITHSMLTLLLLTACDYMCVAGSHHLEIYLGWRCLRILCYIVKRGRHKVK